MPNEVKLLPCPFCGSKRAIPERVLASEWLVMCDKCEATGPSGASKDQAIAAWNTRPTTVVTDEVVERVAKAMADDLSKRHYGIDRGPEDAWEAQTDYGRDEWRHAARAAIASMPTVVTGEQPQEMGDHALPPSGLSQSSLSQAKPAAAIARKGDA